MVRAGLMLLLAAPAAVGQAPPPAGGAAPQPQQRQMDPQLWGHLQAWEGVMKGANNFVSEKGTKVETNELLKSHKTCEATIWCLKPNMARMRLDRLPPPGQPADPSDFNTYICNGRSVFEYEGLTRTMTEYPLGPNGGIGDNLLLEFMSGSITARQAAERFGIEWVNQNDPTYLILELTPLEKKDQAEFEKMTLVLVRPGLAPPLNTLAYLPRMAKLMKETNNKSETWDFPAPMLNAAKAGGKPISPADFQKVEPGKDWRVKKNAPQPPAMPPAGPRVARPGRP